MNKPAVFIGDPDSAYLDGFKESNPNVVVHSANNLRDSQLKIADKSIRFSAICVHASMSTPSCLPIIRFIKAHRPATPMYLLFDDEKQIPEKSQFRTLHIQDAFQKPIPQNILMGKLIPSFTFELDKALDLAKANSMQTGEETDAADQSMHPISAVSFICGKTCFFDVFVKIGSSKFLMILKAGDQMDVERVTGYLKKGVEYFYIKNEAQVYFLQYCDKLTEALISKENISLDIKQEQVLNLGKETFDFLKQSGVSEVSLQSAQRFVQHSQNMIQRSGLKKLSLVDQFIKNLQLADHGAGTVMILSLLLDTMNFSDEKVISTIALGGFLHDIGLLNMPEKFQNEDVNDFTDEEFKEFEKHPILGADIVSKIPHIHPLLPQVIVQHHERRSKKGFPAKLGSGAISPVSEMIGLADTFNQLVRRSVNEANIDPYQSIERKLNEFSANIVDAFRNAIGKNKR